MDRRLQVFVSSTYTDLIAERQAAVGAILKAGHIPAGMELFTAGDQGQMDIIRQWIDESDVYMLILGGRYGSIEPTSGRSYTELEFDYAVSQNKPLFAVVMRPHVLEARVKMHGLAVAETDNKALLTAFEQKVLSNVSSFFEDEKDIKLAVFETLPVLQSKRDMVGWIRGDQVIDSAPFREQNERLMKELDSLRAQLAVAQQKAERVRDPEEQKIQDAMEALADIPLTVPVNVLPKGTSKPWETNHLIFLGANGSHLVGGLSNRVGSSELDRFLYWNVANVLAVYGILKNVKLQGAVRGYELTPFGQKLMAVANSRYRKSVASEPSSSIDAGPTGTGTKSSAAASPASEQAVPAPGATASPPAKKKVATAAKPRKVASGRVVSKPAKSK
ncbi:DUF4062 domain-containing protein [Stenotrophomonas maltophilia group sp. Smal35]|uniref:DUF4062 domain-containing protein n=1 Tax=Stenotrophomonas maltophilia group sp. Smal35 TaxID=3377163 RepID=UPI0025538776|nr:DUF4062 domain-containing protein [Stenotrophomonas maltophilia]